MKSLAESLEVGNMAEHWILLQQYSPKKTSKNNQFTTDIGNRTMVSRGDVYRRYDLTCLACLAALELIQLCCRLPLQPVDLQQVR